MTNYLVVVLCHDGKCHEIEVAATSPRAAEKVALRMLGDEEACSIKKIEICDLGETEAEQQSARHNCKCP